jgi:hypothetical protein
MIEDESFRVPFPAHDDYFWSVVSCQWSVVKAIGRAVLALAADRVAVQEGEAVGRPHNALDVRVRARIRHDRRDRLARTKMSRRDSG